jgi:protein-tyrosine-phosphatase
MNVLFICNENVARSQEAEAFFTGLKNDDSDQAASAGVKVEIDKPLDPLVIEVMSELDIDLSQAHRKVVNEAMVKAANRTISFKPRNELPDYIAHRSDVTYWNIADPRHQNIAFHRQVRDEIRLKVEQFMYELPR